MAQGPSLINKYRPTALSFNSYGWKGSPLYNRADVPAQWVEGVGTVDRTIIEQQMAYEWLNSSDGGGPGVIWTNPPFLGGAAGRLLPMLTTANGTPARILRGFIRRSEAEIGDITSMSRLYFMYNPDSIVRDYVSYLDQGALDPFNTVFQSGNLVAPPSYMDFSFSLFFDRQEEAVVPSNPGVFVDYQYFDLVVRNVVPSTDPNAMNGTLPDNGVMMVNPRDITVVFSPQITVQGRPSNAKVSFTKFTNRMVPTRMQIDLTMRVTYFGPLKDMTPYVKEEAVTAATIPLTDIEDTYNISVEDILAVQEQVRTWITGVVTKLGLNPDGSTSTTDTSSTPAPGATGTSAGTPNATFGSLLINGQILDYAEAQVAAHHTTYKYANRTWDQADCSGLVWRAFMDKGYASSIMGWSASGSDTKDMWDKITNGTSKGAVLFSVDGAKDQGTRRAANLPYLSRLMRGDLLFRINAKENKKGHVSWFDSWDGTPGESTAKIYASMSPDLGVGFSNPTASYIASDYTAAFRPYTAAGDTVDTTPYSGRGPG